MSTSLEFHSVLKFNAPNSSHGSRWHISPTQLDSACEVPLQIIPLFRWRLRSLLLYLCYVFRALINSVVCWFICFHITPPPSPPFFSPPSSILFFCFSECCLCPSFRIFLFLSLSHCYHLSVSFPSLSVFVSVICPSFCCCLPACLSLTVLISVAVCLPVSVSLSPRMRDTRERSPGIDQIQQFMLSRENGSRAVSDMAPSCFRYGKRFFCALV